MLKQILNHKLQAFLVLVLVSLFAIVRVFENSLFYDPFLNFFKGEFGNNPLPEFNPFALIIGLLFRYLINAIISLAIIYVIFKETELVKFASLLYIIFFAVLMIAFFGLLYGSDNSSTLPLFYIRRFLIQPIFVLLFVPAFYYQSRILKK